MRTACAVGGDLSHGCGCGCEVCVGGVSGPRSLCKALTEPETWASQAVVSEPRAGQCVSRGMGCEGPG